MFQMIRKLIPFVGPHWRSLTIALAAMATGIGLELLRPWPTKILVDYVLGQESLPQWLEEVRQWLPGAGGINGLLLWICLATVLIIVAHGAMSLVFTSMAVTFGQRMVYELAAVLFGHLQRLSLQFHRRHELGDLVSRVTVDSYCINTLFCGGILPLIQGLITVIAMFLIMFRLDPSMSLLALSVVPFFILLIYLFGGPMKDRSKRHRDMEGHMTSLVEQTLGALPVIQAYNREKLEEERFRTTAEQAVAAYRRSIDVDMWFKGLIGVSTAIGTAGIMWLGAQAVLKGTTTVGTILVFLAYLYSLYEPLNALVYTAAMLHHAGASAERVLDLLTVTPDLQDRPDAKPLMIQGNIKFENVTFGYEPDRPVLNDISFEVEPGQVVALVGPSGAGKTTLINLIARFQDPWSGRIFVDGCDIRSVRLESLRQQIALVLQDPFIFPLSVGENVAFGKPRAAAEEIIAAARAARADEFVRRLPRGYDSVIGERGATLSGGEKQRLSIARALLKNAPILILDEPTAALDAQTEESLFKALDRLFKGRTTFLIAHRLATIRRADRVLVLDQGRIVETGTREELLRRDGLFARLHRFQFLPMEAIGAPTSSFGIPFTE